jgi:hypothetical protein
VCIPQFWFIYLFIFFLGSVAFPQTHISQAKMVPEIEKKLGVSAADAPFTPRRRSSF